MGLEETARELQKQEESHALKFLRKMRGVRSEYTEDSIRRQWDRIKAYAESPDGGTEAGKETLCRMMADAWKMRQLREFSGEILTAAEMAEKQRKGGGEEWARLSLPLIRHRLEYIDTEHRKMQKYQLELEE